MEVPDEGEATSPLATEGQEVAPAGKPKNERFREAVQKYMHQKGLSQEALARKMRVAAPPKRRGKGRSIDENEVITRSRAFVNRLVNGWGLDSHELGEFRELFDALDLSEPDTARFLQLAYDISASPEVAAYYQLLDHTRYLSTVRLQNDEKEAIAEYFCTTFYEQHLGNHDHLFLDHGSTTTAIAHEIIRRRLHFSRISTNNFVSAICLGSANLESPIELIGGRVDGVSYGGLFGSESLISLERVGRTVTTFVLAATALDFDDGPFGDWVNQGSFKRAIIGLATNPEPKRATRLVIAIDWSKIAIPWNEREHSYVVFSGEEWNNEIFDKGKWTDMLHNYRGLYVMVAGVPNRDANEMQRERFEKTMRQFRSVLGEDKRLIEVPPRRAEGN